MKIQQSSKELLTSLAEEQQDDNRHGDSIVNSFPLHLACAFAVAMLSYYFVEQPMLALRARRAAARRAGGGPVSDR